jgi:peptidoglycan/LPS O-acetylase OafA/YrhL
MAVNQPDLVGRLGYRPALDGLRGLAVALVMVRHLGQSFGVGGGTVGVGTFFALSGFLITTLLVEERRETGAVSLARFWARRACRLLPALAVVLVAVVVWFGLVEHRSYKGPAALAALYAGNWAQIGGRPFGVLAPVWTLAVEEHFYLLWPLVFLALARLRLRTAAGVALGLAGASTLLRLGLFAAGVSPARLQMGTDTRLDGLLLGCAVAFLLARRRPRVPTPAAAVAVAVLAVLVTVPPYHSFMLTAGYVVIPMAALVVIAHLVGGGPASGLTTALSWRPAVGIGRISYGLYLWHLPVYAVLLPHVLGLPLAVRSALVMAVSVAVATASWFAIERPFVRLKAARWSRRPAPAGPTSPPTVAARPG